MMLSSKYQDSEAHVSNHSNGRSPLADNIKALIESDQANGIPSHGGISQFFQKPQPIHFTVPQSQEIRISPSSLPNELLPYSAMHELLFNLLGISSDSTTLTMSTQIVSTMCKYDVPTKELFQRVLPLGINYLKLKQFILAPETKSFTARAMKSALRIILSDYEDLVLTLEKEFHLDTLTIQKIFYYIQTPFEVFQHLAASILLDDLQGCKLILHLTTLVDAVKSHNILCPIYEFILEASLGPIICMTDRFTTEGLLYDPHNEYFIESSDYLKKEDLEEDFNATYWSEKYSMKESLVPAFLSTVSTKILLTGKYVRALSDCQIFLFPITKTAVNYSLQQLSSYSKAIEDRYQTANRAILELLTTKYDLKGHFESIKRTFFMQYGDIYCQFLDLTESDLSLPADQLSPLKLQSHFDHCISSGTGKNDPYSSLIKVELSGYSFSDQLTKIVKMSADDVSAAKSDTLLTGLLALTLSCHHTFPLSIILSMKSMTKYAMIFRHLFSCRATQRQLDRVLIPVEIPNMRLLLQRMDIFRSYCGRMNHLKMKMSFFIRIISGYLFWDVLEHNWFKFEKGFKESHTIDDIITLHTTFLDSCLKECLLTNWKLFRVVNKLFSTCQLFVTLCKKLGKELSTIPIDEIDGVYLKSQQASICKQLVKLDTNFMFHIKLLVHSLQFFSTTDYDHRIGGLIFQLESAFPDAINS